MQFRTHSTETTTATNINSNTSCRWEFINHHAIQRKLHRHKLTELSEFLKRHNVKVDVIPESKLSPNSKTPIIQNFTTVRNDRRQGQGGDLLTLIHNSINFSRKPKSPETLVEPHLEELTTTDTLGVTKLIITNIYIPPASSCTGGYLPSLDDLMMTTDTLILGDFNPHHSAWHSSSTDEEPWAEGDLISHRTLQSLRHIMWNPGDLEVIYCHPYP